MEVAVFKGAAKAASRLVSHCCVGFGADCVLPVNPANSSRLFWAATGQVRAVRAFVRARFAGHPALDDAVLVASELAANSVTHSAIGRDDGLFLVHLAEVSATHAAILLTERRGPGAPVAVAADWDAESGRGLAVVKSLTTFFKVYEEGDVRSILAVVPADALGGDCGHG